MYSILFSTRASQIDGYIRLAVIGIELLTLDARIVLASVDTHLRFAAAAVNRPNLEPGGRFGASRGCWRKSSARSSRECDRAHDPKCTAGRDGRYAEDRVTRP
jgi:hypothetical protein